MQSRGVLLTSLFLAAAIDTESSFAADRIDLFAEIELAESEPPPDSLAVYDSALDITGLAGMPDVVDVQIPRADGDLSASVRLERMDRREGFGERDFWACIRGDASGCEIIAVPGFPPEQFSYTWTGQGDGYDLRLTIHHGNAVGVLSGPQGRFGVAWKQVKELRLDYFLMDDSLVDEGGQGAVPPQPAASASIPVMTAADAQRATVARIGPQLLGLSPSAPGSTQLDMLVLFTEDARKQAGGNPADCHDTNGVMTYIHQNVNSINTAFARSEIPAQVGVVTVTRLNGYTLIPYNGDPNNIRTNLENIQLSGNIKTLRNAVGADVVTTLLDTQANLGVCGVAYIQRSDCGGSAPGCGTGPLFSEWTYFLETIQCSVVDTVTHEVGHVLGAEHDPQHTSATPSTASFPYSFGYGYGSGVPDGFETIMSQRFSPQFPVRLLQFSNPNVLYRGRPTGIPNTAENARTLKNLLPGTAAFRSRPNLVFASGFDETNACPGIVY